MCLLSAIFKCDRVESVSEGKLTFWDYIVKNFFRNCRLLPSPAWAEGTVLGLCVCVLPQNCCLSSIISKSKQAASHKLGNLRQTVVLYKTGKLLQASMAQIA